MLDFNSSVESSPKRVMSANLSIHEQRIPNCMILMSRPHPKHRIANAKWGTYFISNSHVIRVHRPGLHRLNFAKLTSELRTKCNTCTQSPYPYNDSLYNDITLITIYSCKTKSLHTFCDLYFTPITIWSITISPLLR